MSLREPDDTRMEPTIEDSGVHMRDTERAPVTLWQMLVTGLLVIAILSVFFYGVTEQRNEVTGPPSQQAANSVPPPSGSETPKPTPSATVGEGH